MAPDLPQQLRDLAERLAKPAPLDSGLRTLRTGLQTRLANDLLPRTAGGSEHLVVGIVGPNNAGKSALFNALVGTLISPSIPTGGATRSLVGAMSPELMVNLEAAPKSLGLRLLRAKVGRNGIEEARELAAQPTDLWCVEVPNFAPGLLLVDTPDFDSIAQENRLASEALLRAVDLVLVVVTRHTYQNAEVVRFLERWLAHKKPWALVYNESIDPNTTQKHAAKLGRDVGTQPLEVFMAELDASIAKGQAELRPRQSGGQSLQAWLEAGEERERIKLHSMSSSMEQLRSEWKSLRSALQESLLTMESLEAELTKWGVAVAQEIAHEAMPMGPFLEAFRAVLDRRPGLLPRGYRGILGKTRGALARGLNKLTWRNPPPLGTEASTERPKALVEAERIALGRTWAKFYEGLIGILDSSEHSQGEPAQALRALLGPAHLERAASLASTRLEENDEALREFQLACEERMETELDGRRDPWVLQASIDAVHLLPAAVAGLVIVKTGGLGADIAVGGAGALSTLLAERLSRLLGTGVAHAARKRWKQMRAATLGPLLLESAMPEKWRQLGRDREALQSFFVRLHKAALFLESVQ